MKEIAHYSERYLSHPKVKQAKKLLNEARIDLNEQIKNEYGEIKCKCGHKRKSHNPSHSINYTGGSCFEKKCKCLNFI